MAIKHLTPRSRKEIALAKANRTEDEIIEEFIEEFAEMKGSALDIYMGQKSQEKLYDFVINKKYKTKVLVWECNEYFDEHTKCEKKYAKMVQHWIEEGWALFSHEQNYELNEVILIHPPIVKEDAMGGVSAPMATLNNTPGMGNVAPAGVGSIGSGDKFGNTIGGKPYTQAGSPKRKKKKRIIKKKKLEEENINPYDKIGTMMAKKAGVKLPFKKKKEAGNQNAVKQQKFEHEIISFDDFKKLME